MITKGTDTYATLVEARQYATDNDLEIPSDDEALEKLLKQASKGLDRRWANQFLGYKAVPEQPMAWPRLVTNVMSFKGEVWNYTIDSDGNPRNFTGIPVEVTEACVELAAKMQAGDTSIYEQANPVVTSTMAKLDVLQTQVTYERGHIADPLYKVRTILRPVLQINVGIKTKRGE